MSVPSLGEIRKMKVVELKDYLRKRGKAVSGLKEALVNRVLLFWNDPILGSTTAGADREGPVLDINSNRVCGSCSADCVFHSSSKKIPIQH